METVKVGLNIAQKQPPEVFYKKGVLKNFSKFTGKHLRQSLFLIKLQDDMVKHELRNTSCVLQIDSFNVRVEILKERVEIKKCKFRTTSYEFKSTSYEFKSRSDEFKSASYEFNFTSYEFRSSNHQFNENSSKQA